MVCGHTGKVINTTDSHVSIKVDNNGETSQFSNSNSKSELLKKKSKYLAKQNSLDTSSSDRKKLQKKIDKITKMLDGM